MKQEKLIDALGSVAPEYIDEAAPQTPSRSRFWGWLPLAACLALIVCVLLPRRAPEVQDPSPIAEAHYKGGDDPSTPEPNADAQTILSYRFGPLYLGMPRQEVIDLYGEPFIRSNSGPITYEDGITHDSWDFRLTDDPERRSDVTLGFADAGDGWVVNEIIIWQDCGLELPHGIRIGMTDSELKSVWPELSTEFAFEHDGDLDGAGAYPFTSYCQFTGHLRFGIDLRDGVVYAISLGRYYDDPPLDFDETPAEAPYSFASGEITLWQRTDGSWQAVQAADRQAKQVEVLFSIEALIPLGEAPDTAQYAVDFHNGTVCLVCAPDEQGGVYRLDDREAFEASLTAGETPPQGLRLLEQCRFPTGVWALLESLFD